MSLSLSSTPASAWSSQALFQAIEGDDLDRVSQALAQCQSFDQLNIGDDSDETPLMKAAWCKGENRKRILQLVWLKHLQLKDSNLQEALSRKDDEGFNVLMHAAWSEEEEILQVVLGFYKQVFDDLKFLKESISSAELPDSEKKKLTKKIGNGLAKLPPVKKAPNYAKNNNGAIPKSENSAEKSSKENNDDDSSSSDSNGDDDDDDDDEKTPKVANKSRNVDDSSSVSSDDDKQEEKYERPNNNGKQNGKTTLATSNSSLSSDNREELLTTLECMKALALPLHSALCKGKAGHSEVAKLESIMRLMGSMQDVLTPENWQAI